MQYAVLQYAAEKMVVVAVVHVCSALSDSLRPHGLQPARLLCPRDSPGKSTGVGCVPSSRGSSQSRDRSQQTDSSLSEPPGKSKNTGVGSLSLLQGNLPDPGIELGSPALQADSLPAELPGKPQKMVMVGGNSGVRNPLASKPQKHHLLSTADSGFDLFTGVGSGMRKRGEEAQEGSGHRIPGSAPELLFPATRAGLTRCYGSGSRAGVLGVRRQNLGERAELTLYHPRCLSLNSPLKPLHCSCDLLRQCIICCWPRTAVSNHRPPLSRQSRRPSLGPRTHEPSTSMKMKVFRMLVVCFFQELQSSSSFRPIASRVEASGDAWFEEGKKGSDQLISPIG